MYIRAQLFTLMALASFSTALSYIGSRDESACAERVVLSNTTVAVGANSILFESIACNGQGVPSRFSQLSSGAAQQWQQCGGIGWAGATACAFGNFCQDWNPYYSQCIPLPTTSVQPTTVKSTPAPPSTVKSSSVSPSKVSSSPSSVPSPPPPTNLCDQLCTDSCGSLGDLPPISEDCEAIFDSITILNGSISPTFDVPALSIQQLTFGTCRVFFENFSSQTITYCWAALANEASAASTLCFPPTQPVQSLGMCTSINGTWAVGIAHS